MEQENICMLCKQPVQSMIHTTIYMKDLPNLTEKDELRIEHSIYEADKYNDKKLQQQIDECIEMIDIDEVIESTLLVLDENIDSILHIYKNENYMTLTKNYIYGEVESICFSFLDSILSSNDSTLYENIDIDSFHIEDIVHHIVECVAEIFFSYFTVRSYKDNRILQHLNDETKDIIEKHLLYLDELNDTLPPQRTQGWYEYRYTLLSASTIWKAFDSECNKNALIYEKCKPLNCSSSSFTSINSSLHWGVKYEPVSVMYYEYMYDSEIKEYGCIPHPSIDCLGASPDGINIKKSSERYGRMLEIKNIVNRDITGIPKKEYWIQTQFQMECCDLDECDFLECAFKEYTSKTEFDNDGCFQKTQNGKYKGILLCFFKENQPHYEYMPFQCSEKEYLEWEEKTMKEMDANGYIWATNIYWYLKEVSCVCIPRHREWFEYIKPQVIEIWDIIKKERVNGYGHRKPNSNKKSDIKVIKFLDI